MPPHQPLRPTRSSWTASLAYCLAPPALSKSSQTPTPSLPLNATDWYGEADAILPPRQESDATAAVLDAIGPEPGEMLPKIFTDEIRQRVAAQHIAGATVPELAAAWGRTS